MVAISLPVSTSVWPQGDGVGIGGPLIALDPLFEPSGIVWMAERGTYVVVGDEGQVAEIKPDGTVLHEWKLGSQYDLEDVTVVDPASSLVYLGDENNSSAREFDLYTGTLTGRSWSFASKISEVNGSTGLEGLAFVPDGSHPFGTTVSGGVFYAGWQYDGDIYVFAPDLGASGSQTFIEEIHMTTGYTDLSALSYNFRTERVYALYDGLNILEERDAAGLLVATYDVPGSNQEGIAVADEYPLETATVFIAEDSGGIYFYAGYPVSYPYVEPPVVDADGDGVPVESDCNDADASVSVEQVYYVDADLDGMGSTVSASLCASSAPEGYSTNALDTDDTIPNAGVEIGGDGRDNDGDGIVDEWNTLAENGAHPYFSTLTPVSGSGYGTDILSAVGQRNGDILVEYADHAFYLYDVYAVKTRAIPSVTSLDGSTYLIVALGKRTALVNGNTGVVVATTRGFKYSWVAAAWARSVVGW